MQIIIVMISVGLSGFVGVPHLMLTIRTLSMLTQIYTPDYYLCSLSLNYFLHQAMLESSVSNESLALARSCSDTEQLPVLSHKPFNVQAGL